MAEDWFASGRRRWGWSWCRRSAAVVRAAAAEVQDDAGAFPRFDKAVAWFRAAELQDEVVHVVDAFDERGGVGFHFAQQGAAVHDLAARGAHLGGEVRDGGAERGDAGGGDTAIGGVGLGLRGHGEVADSGGLASEVLVAQTDDGAFAEVHFAEAV